MTKNAVLLLRDRSFFGANIVNLPTIYLVKKYFSADTISVFTDINLQYFYQQISWVTHQFDCRNFYQIYKNIPANTRLLYSMRPSMDSAPLFKYLRKIDRSIGLSLRSTLLNRLFDCHYPYLPSEYRAISHIRPLLNYLGLSQKPNDYLREAMLDLINSPSQPVQQSVAIMPGAGGGEHKKWGINKYWHLVEKLSLLKPHLHFNFIIGSNEKEEEGFLRSKKLSSKVSFTIEKNLGLIPLTQLINESALVIANDCGPSHIAQCLVKPFIGLYLEPNPEWFLSHKLSYDLCPLHSKDIKEISVDEVLEKSLLLLHS